MAQQIIDAPLYVSAQREVRYDSPITGEPITSRAAWKEDLRKHHCVEYDPGMVQDHLRHREAVQEKLEASIDSSVAEAVGKMNTKQRAELWSSVKDQGAGLDVVRSTPQT